MHVGMSPLAHMPLDDIRRQLDVNVVGQVAVTQARAGVMWFPITLALSL